MVNRVLMATSPKLVIAPAIRAAVHCPNRCWSAFKMRCVRQLCLLRWSLLYVAYIVAMLTAFAVVPILGLIMLCAAIFYIKKQGEQNGDTEYGQARFADLRELAWRGYLYPYSGLAVGRVLDGSGGGPKLAVDVLTHYPKHGDEQAIRVSQAIWYGAAKRAVIALPEQEIIHTAIYGRSGSGKSQGHAIANLLIDPAAVLVTDCKNEIGATVSRHRQKVFGHEQIFIAPFGDAPPGFECHAFNPFSAVNLQSKHVISDAIHFAKAMIRPDKNETQPFFTKSAILVLDAVLSFMLCHSAPCDLTLKKDREITTNPDALRTMAELMLQSNFGGGYLKVKAHQLLSLTGKTLTDVLATVNSHLFVLDSLAVEHATHWTTFDIRKLLTGNLDIYLCLPVSRSEDYGPLLRCWITSIAHLIFSAGVGRSETVRMYFDEASLLGSDLPILEHILTKGRAFGLKTNFYWQSIHQIAEVFPDHQTQVFREQMSVEQFMEISTYTAAKEVSQWAGQKTVRVHNESQTYGWSQSHTNGMQPSETAGISGSTTRGYQKAGRALIQPEELLQLPPDVTLVLKPGCPMIMARKLKAYLAADRAELTSMLFGRSPDLQAAKTFHRGSVVLVLMILAGLALLHPKEMQQFKADVVRMWNRQKPATQEAAKQVPKMTAKQRRVERLWQKKEEAQRRRFERMYFDAYQ